MDRRTSSLKLLLLLAFAGLCARPAAGQISAFEEETLVAPAPAPGDTLGWSVAVDGEWAVAGATFAGGSNAGRAFAYRRNSFGWEAPLELVGLDSEAVSFFGTSVAIFGTTIAVGAPQQGPGGAVYVFEFDGASWVQQQKVVGNDTAGNDDFGFSVALGQDRLAVGAPDEDAIGQGSGSVYVFERSGSVWTQDDKLTGSELEQDDEGGYSVALDGDRLIWGAKGHEAETGIAFVFEKVGGTWVEDGVLSAGDSLPSDRFGQAVSISGTRAVVGAPYASTNGTLSGAVYVFQRVAGVWTEVDRLVAPLRNDFDYFGASVDLSGAWLAIGAYEHDSGGPDSGAAFVARRVAGVFGEPQPFLPAAVAGGEWIGRSVAFDDGLLVAGAPLAQASGEGNLTTFRVGAVVGSRYCDPAVPNSSGVAGEMHVLGDVRVVADELTLVATNLPLGNIGYFLMGTGNSPFTPNGSAGPICIAPNVQRFLPPAELTSELDGGFTRSVGTSGPISSIITVGSTWNFQAWHRDGMGLSNFTDAVSVTFE